MSKTAISQYSATPSSNSDVDGIDISEGCPASNLNNAQRSLMSHLKEMDDGTSALTSPSMGRLNVDNLRLDGNTISSTDTNGNISLSPNGTGSVAITGATVTSSGGSASAPAYAVTSGSLGVNGLFVPAANTLGFSAASTERMRIDASGNVGIGTTSPTSKLDANGHIRVTGGTDCDIEFQSGSARRKFIGGDGNNLELGTYSSSNTSRDVHMSIDSGGFLTHARASGAAQSMVGYKNGGNFVGEIRTSTTATSYITSSDYRLKENVTYDWDATTRLKQLKPARFNFIADSDTTVDGFLAHEAQAVVPESVSGTHNEVDDDGNPVMQGIDQAKLVPLLTKALIESVEKIEQLEARITALEAE